MVKIDKNKCADCGACTAACNFEALVFNSEWSLETKTENCTGCSACVKACPTRAISEQK